MNEIENKREKAQELLDEADKLETELKMKEQEEKELDHIVGGYFDPNEIHKEIWRRREDWFLGPGGKIYEYRYVTICGHCKKVLEPDGYDDGYCYHCHFTRGRSFKDHIMVSIGTPTEALKMILREERKNE